MAAVHKEPKKNGKMYSGQTNSNLLFSEKQQIYVYKASN